MTDWLTDCLYLFLFRSHCPHLDIRIDYLNDMLGPLSGFSDDYVSKAGRYAEALAVSKLCKARFARSETEPACFNGAAASAVSFYRRAGDEASAERVVLLGNAHPNASTHWRSTLQTPRVMHTYSSTEPSTEDDAADILLGRRLTRPLRSQPWWPAERFSAAK